jgi:type IV secretion system protein VirB3
MAEKGGIQSDQLFLGLTRPAMVMGVHYLIFMINFMVCILIFINSSSSNKLWQTPVIFIIIHMMAYLVCLKEPRAIELLFTRYGKFSKCRNRVYHKHTNSYDLN